MSHSSLVDLKAELLRKQEQLRKERAQNASKLVHPKPVPKKASVWSKRNAGVLERAQRDLEAKEEAEDILSKSKAALQAKAKYYEQMTRTNSVPEEDGSKLFLVDFQKKVIDRVLGQKIEKEKQQEEAKRQKQREEDERKEEAEERRLLSEKVAEPDDPEEQWVDYVDSLGRSRRCLKKDLPVLQKMDKNLAPAGKEEFPKSDSAHEDAKPDLMSADMYREMLRKKWEQEEQEALSKPDGPVHYANVQYDEARTHGVGYFQFSRDEESRQEQMKSLGHLREQTLDHRARKEALKLKRAVIMKARLAKVRRRAMIREGKNPDEVKQEEEDDSDEEMVGPKLSEKDKAPEPLVREDLWRKDAPMREWDKGKKVIFNEETWLEERRSERMDEFAPPSMYYNNTGPSAKSAKRNPQTESCGIPGKMAKADNPMAEKDEVQDAISAGLSGLRKGLNMPEHLASEDVAAIPLPLPEENVPNYSGDLKEKNSVNGFVHDNVNVYGQCAEYYQQQQYAPYPYPSPHFGPMPPYFGFPGPMLPPHMPPPPYYGGMMPYYAPSTENVGQHFPRTTVSPTPSAVPNDTTENAATFGATQSSVTENAKEAQSTEDVPPSDQAQSAHPNPDTSSVQEAGAASAATMAPQPAHFAAAPAKPQPQKRHYQRVNLHELPACLPAPPTAGVAAAEYPSQEIFIPTKQHIREPRTEKDEIKHWQKQFQYSGAKTEHTIPRTKNIPFPAPNIQKKDDCSDVFAKGNDFDPTIPPPNMQN